MACPQGESIFEPGRCNCDYASVDALAVPRLRNIPREPWEQAEKYLCLGIGPVASGDTLSTEGQEDVCTHPANPGWLLGSIAVGHSHPYFDPHFDYSGDGSVRCGSFVIRSQGDAMTQNWFGTFFSPADMNLGLPLYLVVSDRLEVKVYRMNAAGEWGEEILWEGQPE